MAKTVQSLLHEARAKFDFWTETYSDEQALADKGKTKEQVKLLVNYFEGKMDALEEVQEILNPNKTKFEKGQKVVCVIDDNRNLTEGKEYVILSIIGSHVTVVDDAGWNLECFATRFKEV